MTAAEFVAAYGPFADQAALGTGLNRWAILTQWALETGFAAPDSGVPFNNLAGIRDSHYPLNAAGFSIYPSLDAFVADYVGVLHQPNMAPILQAAGRGIGDQILAFGSGEWVGTDRAANEAYGQHLLSLYGSTLAPLAEGQSSPPPPQVAPPPSSESGGLSVSDRDYLYAELVKLAHATGQTLDTPPWAAPAQRTYTVKPGDNLSEIAQAYLGDANRWHEIHALNEGVIGGNPDLIHPGQVLVLPPE